VAARSAAAAFAVAALLAGGAAAAHTAGPTPTAAPSVSGIAAAGKRLAAASGTWTSASAVSYAYQWYRCDRFGGRCSSVHGATGTGYVLTRRDVGDTIGLTVTATDASGSTSAYASLVGPVAHAKPLLESTAQPQVTGVPIAGNTLQVTTGAWSPAPTSLTYSWLRCNANGRACAPIGGAHASSYTVGGADAGHALVALVQGGFGAAAQAALSTATAAAVGGDLVGPTPTALPAVAGTLQQGAQLTGTSGIWTGAGSLSYAYQWYRCDATGAHCSSIHGATLVTYRAVAADVGKTLGFTVRATDSTGTASAYASLVGPVAAAGSAPASTAQPWLAGTPHPGSVLTAGPGGWQPEPDARAYAWLRCNANGRACVPIAGAAQPSYRATAADAGHALVAVVTATAGGAAQAALSAASRPVS